MGKVNVFWFRRDLRCADNAGLYAALCGELPVVPVFIFDTNILSELPKDDARISFIYKLLRRTNEQMRAFGGSLYVLHGTPENAFGKLFADFDIAKVFTNRDYEPYAIRRDNAIAALLEKNGAELVAFKDQVIFEQDEIVRENHSPYVVFTPYEKRWMAEFGKSGAMRHPSERHLGNILNRDFAFPSLGSIGFEPSKTDVPDFDLTADLVENYTGTRNFPALEGTSRLSPHLRFGSVSIREIAAKAGAAHDKTFLKELVWREFFMQILWHFPQTVTRSFRPKYDNIVWRNDEADFRKWRDGRTGYPIVDAGMRQLNASGWMHNRVRMIAAGFLCKHLLIDWRWGEAYFAEKLLDYEQASNVGNWQWIAGSGVDAAPYFRIFNPDTQLEKFDKTLEYVRKWIPEYGTDAYPEPMVGHKEARERCLKVYRDAVGSEMAR
jgi:deoxyribodipyrimidine photo-lyase